jgi:hypothetical protein
VNFIRRIPALSLGSLLLGSLLLGSLLLVTLAAAPARAKSPSADPATAAGYGATWLAGRSEPDGGYGAVGSTADAALALAAAGVGEDTFRAAVAWLQDQAATVASGRDPGLLGKVILAAVVAGHDPNDFGGADLVGALLATRRTAAPDAGLFGDGDPTFDGVFRQSLALLGLAAAGTAAPADATQWLTAQQCASGGWRAHRADPSSPCPDPDPANFTGEDTNSTALAIQALAALGVEPAAGDPLDWLDSIQNENGGFGFFAGDPTDANSTGLAAQAVVARGEDPGAGRWATAGGSVYGALLDLQLGCEAPAGDRGAFVFQAGGPADVFATTQAVPGAAGRALPFTADFGPDSPTFVCDSPRTTTTTTTPTSPSAAPPGARAEVLGASGTLPATGPGPAAGLEPGELAGLGFGLAGAGAVLVRRARRRRAA